MLKDNLIMLRNVHGFSQEELAEKIGIALIPAETFEAKLKDTWAFASKKIEE